MVLSALVLQADQQSWLSQLFVETAVIVHTLLAVGRLASLPDGARTYELHNAHMLERLRGACEPPNKLWTTV